MIDACIKFNMKNVIDAQVTYTAKSEKNFGLKATCKSAQKHVKFNAVHDAIKEKKDIDLNDVCCYTKKGEDTFSQMHDDKFR